MDCQVAFIRYYSDFEKTWVVPLGYLCQDKGYNNIRDALDKFPRLGEGSEKCALACEVVLNQMHGCKDIRDALRQFIGTMTEEERLFIEQDEKWIKNLQGWRRIFEMIFAYKNK